jgi:predicted amidohydrolase
MLVRDGDPDGNRHTLLNYLDDSPGCDLYLLPELWTCGYVHDLWQSIARDDTPLTLRWMKRQALARKIYLGGSVIAENEEGSLVNRFVLYDRDGTLACKYDKAHLFRPLEEDIYLQAGAYMPPVINIEGIRVSPAICYDLRFPEMFRRTALLGVDLFLVSSEWPVPREHVLRVLSESRAIENQAILALSNRIGVDDRGNRFCGFSGIFGPNGIVVDAMQKQGVFIAEIDTQTLIDTRSFLPVLSDRLQGIDYV